MACSAGACRAAIEQMAPHGGGFQGLHGLHRPLLVTDDRDLARIAQQISARKRCSTSMRAELISMRRRPGRPSSETAAMRSRPLADCLAGLRHQRFHALGRGLKAVNRFVHYGGDAHHLLLGHDGGEGVPGQPSSQDPGGPPRLVPGVRPGHLTCRFRPCPHTIEDRSRSSTPPSGVPGVETVPIMLALMKRGRCRWRCW